MRMQQQYARAVMGVGLMLALALLVQPVLPALHLFLDPGHDHGSLSAHAGHRCGGDDHGSHPLPQGAYAVDSRADADHCRFCESLQAAGHSKTLLPVSHGLPYVYASSRVADADVNLRHIATRASRGRAPPVLAG